mmetsp:Transcript_172608/g.548083  ORF Transcript_172608/g.548083 Transcript_172608/m.548083 type:complete len:210 (-) Transcript_172608:84-713(-)
MPLTILLLSVTLLLLYESMSWAAPRAKSSSSTGSPNADAGGASKPARASAEPQCRGKPKSTPKTGARNRFCSKRSTKSLNAIDTLSSERPAHSAPRATPSPSTAPPERACASVQEPASASPRPGAACSPEARQPASAAGARSSAEASGGEAMTAMGFAGQLAASSESQPLSWQRHGGASVMINGTSAATPSLKRPSSKPNASNLAKVTR